MNTDDTDKRKVSAMDALAALAAKEKSEAAEPAASPAGDDPFSRLAAQAASERATAPAVPPSARQASPPGPGECHAADRHPYGWSQDRAGAKWPA